MLEIEILRVGAFYTELFLELLLCSAKGSTTNEMLLFISPLYHNIKFKILKKFRKKREKFEHIFQS